MNPTGDPRILETDWFCNPEQPLMEYKYYHARVGTLVYYVTAFRGVTNNIIKPSTTPVAVEVTNAENFPDNSAEQFNALQKFLNKPIV